MLINVLDKDLTKIAIVDTFTSLMWCKRYYEAGALDLQIEATRQNLELFTDGRFITRDDDETVYVIRAVQLETKENRDNSLIVGAVDCKSILNQRIIWGIINYSGTVENYIRKLVTDNIISPALWERRIPNFTLGDMVGFPETIKQQASYVNIGEKISELCKTYDIGCTVSLDDNGMFVLDIYRGVNRSQSQKEVNPLVFSPEFDNLVSSKYEVDSTKYKNACLVGGEGEGKDRKTLAVGNAFGIERHEIFIDQKSSSSNTEETISEADYYESLRSKGEGELAKLAVKAEFEGEVVSDSYQYKVDYNLGDTVTVINEFGVTADAKIVEIVETWDSEGYTLEPIFEFSEVKELIPTEKGALLSENGAMLMTTRNRAIVAEQPEEYTEGVRISDLDLCSTCTGIDYIPVVQNGETKKATIATLFNAMSDYEEFTYSTVNTPVPYNGFISFVLTRAGSSIRSIYVNDVLVSGGNSAFSTDYKPNVSCMVVVKKGDMIRGSNNDMKAYARWFKD